MIGCRNYGFIMIGCRNCGFHMISCRNCGCGRALYRVDCRNFDGFQRAGCSNGWSGWFWAFCVIDRDAIVEFDYDDKTLSIITWISTIGWVSWRYGKAVNNLCELGLPGVWYTHYEAMNNIVIFCLISSHCLYNLPTHNTFVYTRLDRSRYSSSWHHSYD